MSTYSRGKYYLVTCFFLSASKIFLQKMQIQRGFYCTVSDSALSPNILFSTHQQHILCTHVYCVTSCTTSQQKSNTSPSYTQSIVYTLTKRHLHILSTPSISTRNTSSHTHSTFFHNNSTSFTYPPIALPLTYSIPFTK